MKHLAGFGYEGPILSLWLGGGAGGRDGVRRSCELGFLVRLQVYFPGPIEILLCGPVVALAGDSESGSVGRGDPPEPAEPVCHLSASEGSVCLFFISPPVCACASQRGVCLGH